MEIKITPENVDEFIKESFMKSTIGESIAKFFNKELSEFLTSTYKSPIPDAIKYSISDVVRARLRESEEVKKIIDEKIIEAINKIDLKTEVIDKLKHELLGIVYNELKISYGDNN